MVYETHKTSKGKRQQAHKAAQTDPKPKMQYISSNPASTLI